MPANATFSLVVNNNSGNNNQRNIALSPYSGAQFSRIDLNSATIINVDSIQTWNAAYNGGAQQTSFYPGATVFVRATISDPFGSFDISDARLWITDAATPTPGAPVSNLQMTPGRPDLRCHQLRHLRVPGPVHAAVHPDAAARHLEHPRARHRRCRRRVRRRPGFLHRRVSAAGGHHGQVFGAV